MRMTLRAPSLTFFFFVVACASQASEPRGEPTSSGEEVAASETAPSGPAEGSPECAGCSYTSTPGHVGPGGGGGIAELCLRMGDGEGVGASCPMSCCASRR